MDEKKILVYIGEQASRESISMIMAHPWVEMRKEEEREAEEKPCLHLNENGLSLVDKDKEFHGDFERLIARMVPNNLNHEMLVKAAKLKGVEGPLSAVDATAGLGEDGFLLAAAGYEVTLFERDKKIALLAEDAIRRGKENPLLVSVLNRMHLIAMDSIEGMKGLKKAPDVVLLDPMFPARQKSGLIKKKFQLLQQLESPCADEEELLEAAMEANPRRIIIKRPSKGPYLAGIQPSYSLDGKSIRYDCIVRNREK